MPKLLNQNSLSLQTLEPEDPKLKSPHSAKPETQMSDKQLQPRRTLAHLRHTAAPKQRRQEQLDPVVFLLRFRFPKSIPLRVL